MNLDDLKVAIASVTGLGNWMVEIDLVLKVAISVASLIYIGLKIRKLLKNDD
tara:strand:+ start:167 stop:322 length:156 start_codon:yes stop_codon:yes gene_type:complete